MQKAVGRASVCISLWFRWTVVARCYGFAWQGFGSGGAITAVSVRSCEKIPPCLTEPVPASSETDPPLAKAKPISSIGSTSVITYLRRGRCVKIWFYFSLSYCDLIGDKLKSLFSRSSVCFVHGSNWRVISPCPYLDPWAFHHISSPLSSW